MRFVCLLNLMIALTILTGCGSAEVATTAAPASTNVQTDSTRAPSSTTGQSDTPVNDTSVPVQVPPSISMRLGQLFVMTGVAFLILATFTYLINQQNSNNHLDILLMKARRFSIGTVANRSTHNPSISNLENINHILDNMAKELTRTQRHKRTLIKMLINAQQEERKRVAYDIHDGLIQQLVGAHFYLAMVRDKLSDSNQGIEELDRAYSALSKAIGDGRRIIQGLHPSTLDDLGLAEAIKELAYQFADIHGWKLELNFQPLPHPPDKSVSVTVFRVAQEALNNISKHAKAKVVKVKLTNGDCIRLTIEDDGLGFSDSTVNDQKPHFGITTMHERAAIIQGTCNINSRPGQGTRVSLIVPYDLNDEIVLVDDIESF